VDYGVHLPLTSLKGQRHWSLRGLLEYTEIAERLGLMDRRHWPRYSPVRDRWL
jgi:hypothetical protein